MSLYYDAARILSSASREGSLKSRVYENRLGVKSKPAHLFALISETAKYNAFLKEVIEHAGILSHEARLTPLLSLLLVHDLLFAKGGIAAPAKHPLRVAVEKHRARLQSEFTRARIKRKCATVQDLKACLSAAVEHPSRVQPRWVRVNTLRTTLEQQLATTFQGYQCDGTVAQVIASAPAVKVLALDPHISNLIALPPATDVTKTPAYVNGHIVLQDKASCFPAVLLAGTAGEDHESLVGDCLDACAAPGNKTSHLAALLAERKTKAGTVYACERDRHRSQTLLSMMAKTGAQHVTVLAAQDFLALDPLAARYQCVTHLLLDPSCSGSGIVGRDDIPQLALPSTDGHTPAETGATPGTGTASLKRKRSSRHDDHDDDDGHHALDQLSDVETKAESGSAGTSAALRLQKLSALQTKIVERALAFPAAMRVTYSTCSVHVEENETVVARVLRSLVAQERGWRVLRRDEQPAGLRDWPHRGVLVSTQPDVDPSPALDEREREACIRCHPGDEQGTMGFFVCGFVRSAPVDAPRADDEWQGFSD